MTTKTEILRAIRQNCLECTGNSVKTVQECSFHACNLYPFRFGSDPSPAKAGMVTGFATRQRDSLPKNRKTDKG